MVARRPHPVTPAVFAAISLVWLSIVGGMFADGLASLASGHLKPPFLLIPLAFAAFFALFFVYAPPKLRNETTELLNEPERQIETFRETGG